VASVLDWWMVPSAIRTESRYSLLEIMHRFHKFRSHQCRYRASSSLDIDREGKKYVVLTFGRTSR